jgi:pyridoxal phosphate enzyme (YggS family)
MTSIATNLQAVKDRIRAVCRAHGRAADAVALLAVSKTWPAESVRAAAACGQHAFGENYVQEAVDKITALADLNLEWHFIGPLQANKTKLVATYFDWVHSIERLKIAERLSLQRPDHLPPLQVCVQVNVSGEDSKSGCAPEEAEDLALAVASLPHLQLRGLMAIPEPTEDLALLASRFASLRALGERLKVHGLALDTLSMGMSHDLETAIAAGATIVRVGTAIFGERHYPTHNQGNESPERPT